MKQLRIPAAFIRGGTSNAVVFNQDHLPTDRALWDDIFMAAIGSPDPYGRQLDGMGGGLSSLSKVCVVGPPTHPEADIDYAFRFNGAGWADVLENGVYQSGGDTPYEPGDVFRVAIFGNKIQYIRNGVVLMEHPQTVQYPVLLDVALAGMGASIRNAVVAVAAPRDGEGGFLEKDGSHTYRPRFTQAEIASFLPANGVKGAFTFPAPYNTKGVRLTNASDCDGGQDCFWYVGYFLLAQHQQSRRQRGDVHHGER